MLGEKYGKYTALIINILGAILTIYLLTQFQSGFYALAFILFALSVSATQCKTKLKITLPIMIINLCVTCLGTLTSFYLIYAVLKLENSTPIDWVTPVSLGLLAAISLINVIIIRNLHFSNSASELNT